MAFTYVTPLGSSASDVGAAINQIIDYLQRGTKLAQPNTSPTIGYYADSAEGPGVWRGRGVGGHQLTGTVDPEILREVLSGRHPETGHQLVMATGSAGRAQRERSPVDVATNGPPDELLSTEQVAALLGTTERYVRKLALDTRAATNPATPGEAATYRRARLQGIQLGTGAWAFRREDVERFAAHREEPKVVVAYDVTVSVEKSISLAWVHANTEQRRQIEQAIDTGVNAAVSYLEEHALNVRRGRGSEQADGAWAASYRHLTNRHLEPQLHEHILIANVAAPATGGPTQAIDARGLMHHAKTAGYVAGAVIRNELTRTLGVEWLPVEQGLSDLAGIPRSAIDAMSTRRKEIESVAAELGLDSRDARQYAALSTRRAKQEPTDWLQLETDWQTKLDNNGFTQTNWLQLIHADRRNIAAPTQRHIAALNDWLDSPEGITRRNAIFTRRDVVQHIIDHDAASGSNRLTLDLIETLTDRFLASTNVLTIDVPAAQRSRTGENVWYTTIAILQLEQSVINTYQHGMNQLVAAVPTDMIRAATKHWETETGHTLGDDQHAMIHSICTTSDRFAIVVGPAGTGKTAALEVAARAWETARYRPLGISVTGAATDQLGAATGIETRTVASLLDALNNGHQPLDARTVLVVDEASTLTNRDHAAIIGAVVSAGARMVTIGDPAQHAAVDAGGLWAHLVDTLGDRVSQLDINRRQASPTMTDVRLANADYREGRIVAALARLETGERIVSARLPHHNSWMTWPRIGTSTDKPNTSTEGRYRG
jgi:conjugative relaxase-like TrwC/TraI family protein